MFGISHILHGSNKPSTLINLNAHLPDITTYSASVSADIYPRQPAGKGSQVPDAGLVKACQRVSIRVWKEDSDG